MADKKKSRELADDIMAGVRELRGYIAKGMTADDTKAHFRKKFPGRIRTFTKTSGKWVQTDPSVMIGQPGKYSAAALKKLRVELALSQAVFAESLGVSAILVQSWERGVREPSPLARRLLDIIIKDPAGWLASLAAPGKSRRAG